MPLDDERDAALLRLNAGGLLVVPLLAGPALFVYYVLSSQVGIVGPFLVVWPISVALPTVLQLARARYPYTLGLKAIDPGMLTLAQLRALTFIRSSEGHRFTLRAGGVLTLIVAAVSGFALLCPYPRTFFLGGGDYGSWRSFATVC